MAILVFVELKAFALSKQNSLGTVRLCRSNMTGMVWAMKFWNHIVKTCDKIQIHSSVWHSTAWNWFDFPRSREHKTFIKEEESPLKRLQEKEEKDTKRFCWPSRIHIHILSTYQPRQKAKNKWNISNPHPWIAKLLPQKIDMQWTVSG